MNQTRLVPVVAATMTTTTLRRRGSQKQQKKPPHRHPVLGHSIIQSKPQNKYLYSLNRNIQSIPAQAVSSQASFPYSIPYSRPNRLLNFF